MSKDFLKLLNPEQLSAVEKIYGTVLVIAGPGTGKTQMLTARIANILDKTDANAENILCLTFTESGAIEMRKRLQKWIGSLAYRVKICTFHAFCENVMQTYPESFVAPPNVEGTLRRGAGVLAQTKRSIADDLQKTLIFRKIIDAKQWKHLKPFGDNYFWQRSFFSAISQMKRENVSRDKLKKELIPKEKEILENDPDNFYKRDCKYGKKGEMKNGVQEKIEQKIAKMYELADIWENYEKEMQRQGLYDFDDLISQVVEKIQTDEDLKLDIQEQYQFILVDEYQDTNSSQNQILWMIADFFEDPNLFAVGDDDQSIYRFQGASLENIIEFEKNFPSTQRLTLTRNYRSAQKVLDGAFATVAHNLERIDHEKSLIASGNNKKTEGILQKAIFHARFSELTFLAESIQKEIDSGTSPGEIAILVRENKEVREIATHLQQFKIPVSTQIIENIFDDQNVQFLIQMLRVFNNPTIDHEFYELLHAPFFDIEAHELFDLSVSTENGRKRVAQVLSQKNEERKALMNEENLKIEDCSLKMSGLEKVHTLFLTAQKNYYHLAPERIAERMFHDSGMAKYLADESNSNRLADLLKIRKFIEWIAKQNNDSVETKNILSLHPLHEILEKTDLHRELGVAIFPDPIPRDFNSVQIMTAHRSKGMEFDTVFMPGLLDKVWGNPRAKVGLPLPHLFKVDHDQNEDERRLFFVAMTRAKKKIVFSHAEKDFSGRSRMPSIFWHEVPDDMCDILDTESLHTRAQELLPVFFSTPTTPLLTGEEKSILKRITENYVWSATSLQNFLDCPRKFLYLNLLKIPTPKNKFLGFGVAIHAALQSLFEEFKNTNQLPSLPWLLDHFEQALRRTSLSRTEFENALSHGGDILTGYYNINQSKFHNQVMLELDFKKYNTHIEGIPITGKIDKIEFDKTGKEGTLIDYKSGKPQKIEPGQRLWRQMVFYDLMVRNTPQIKWEVNEVALDFLPPNDNGKFIRTPLQITDEDRTQVINELKEANAKIQKLEFSMVENPDNDPEIEYWQNFGVHKRPLSNL